MQALFIAIMALLVSIGSIFMWRLMRKDVRKDKSLRIFADLYFGFLVLAGLGISISWIVEWIKG